MLNTWEVGIRCCEIDQHHVVDYHVVDHHVVDHRRKPCVESDGPVVDEFEILACVVFSSARSMTCSVW